MSGVIRGLVCAGLVASTTGTRAQGAAPTTAATNPAATNPAATNPAATNPAATNPAPPAATNPAATNPATKAAATKAPRAKPAKPTTAGPTAAPSAAGPSASAPPSASPTKKEADAAKPSEAAPASDAPGPPAAPSIANPSAAPATSPAVRVFMRSGSDPLLFSARAKNDTGRPTWCSAPCDARLPPGDYQLRLNGVVVDGPLKVVGPGTLQGKLESREASREGGWLALNVGGILGGVFVTVAALGGPSWAYIAGGGSLLSGGAIFALTYRADRATVSFSPDEPVDVRGLPPPAPAENNSSGPTPSAALDRADHPRLGAQARGLGLRVHF